MQAVQLAGDLAGLLPAEQATARKNCELHVAMFINTVREQMRYDTRLVAGRASRWRSSREQRLHAAQSRRRPARSREKVGTAAMAMKPDQLDGRGRLRPPRSRGAGGDEAKEPGQHRLQLTRQAGREYEYVCTLPRPLGNDVGQADRHQDVDAYLQSNPDASPTKAAASHEHHK